ncbi:hypothetical protein [Mesomycoplasma lagogenitalium]|uniref:Glycosyl hydrolase family 13 catalytic domain-containing protein n=1 Tax=Mesomycoplasma lagogenitalium TaxID=171286 RepID=A0ABY8LUU4_9BACT|nr:hypothetical protein [Mesomycoplasma lagogenitalium]WGI36313.1 hypothetical protein QEG99_02435 [Mesomycoplasma lagogenitalium]
MKKNVRKVYYEIFPRYFYDSNSSGVGDYLGIAEKHLYFKELEIDNLVFPSILENYEELKPRSFIQKHYGSIDDFKKMVQLLKMKDIKINMIFDFDKADSYFKQFENLQTILKNDVSENELKIKDETIQMENQDVTKVIDVEWMVQSKIEKFLEIIKFYNFLKIDGIIFKNIYKVNFPKLSIDESSHLVINSLMEKIKENISDINLIAILDYKTFYQQNTEQLNLLKFDEFIFDYFSEFWLNDQDFKIEIKKYNWLKMLKFALKMQNLSKDYSTFIFNNWEYGKIASRLSKKQGTLEYLQKFILGFFILFDSNFYLVQGDEIGQENILNSDVKNKKIHPEISQENNKVNFAWNSNKAMGLNEKEISYYLTPKNYLKNNLLENYKNKNSVWWWVKNLLYFKKMYFTNYSISKKIIFSMYFYPDVFKIKLNNFESHMIYLNFSNKNKKFLHNIVGKNFVVKYDSYNSENINNTKIKELKPFQIIILEKNEKKL